MVCVDYKVSALGSSDRNVAEKFNVIKIRACQGLVGFS